MAAYVRVFPGGSWFRLILRFETTPLLARITLRKARVTFMFMTHLNKPERKNKPQILLIFPRNTILLLPQPKLFLTLLVGVGWFPKWISPLDDSIHPFRRQCSSSLHLILLRLHPFAWWCSSRWFQLDSFSRGGDWCTDWPLYSWISH